MARPLIPPGRRLVFLGGPLDPDERQPALEERLILAGEGPDPDPEQGDPRPRVLDLLTPRLPPGLWRDAGSLEVPGWLRPLPPARDHDALSVENMVRFLDGQGCRAAAQALARRVEEAALPDIPCLIGVDHSLTGGVVEALAQRLGPENLALAVLDSHLDAVPMPVMAGAIAYDMERNPASLHDPDDPFLQDRADSYNASSFLHHLLAEGLVLPQNLILIGLGDYPPKQALASKDGRIQAYARCWTGLVRQGARLVTKQDLGLNPAKLATFLRQIKAPHLHLSIDMDVGAMNAVEAVRFTDRAGLSRDQLMKAMALLRQALTQERGPALAGLDLMEFNPRHPQAPLAYQLATDLALALLG